MIWYLSLSILIGSTFSLMVKADSHSFLSKFKIQVAFVFSIIILTFIGYSLNHSGHIYFSSVIWFFLVAVTPTILILFFKEYFAWSALVIFILGIVFLVYGNFHNFIISVEDLEIYSGSIHKILTLSKVEGLNVNMFILSDLYKWGEQSYILQPFRETLTVDITGFIFVFSSLSSLATYFLPETLSSFKKKATSNGGSEFKWK